MSKKTFTTRLKVPASWRWLVTDVFPDDLKGVKDAKQRKRIADPKPYYDDDRVIGGAFPGTRYTFELGLHSAQSNYWGSLMIYDQSRGGAWIYESDPLDSFGDVEEHETDHGTFRIEIEWVR